MNWFTKIFSSTKSVDKAVDTVTNVVNSAVKGFDSMWFTDEEKANQSIKMGDKVTEFVEKTLSENTTRSKTRRMLSLMVMGEWLFLLLFAVIAWPFSSDYAKFVIETAMLMNTLVLMVAAFFWGAYAIKNYWPLKNKGNEKSKQKETTESS